MFHKTFKIKSNVALKGSDKKRLRVQVKSLFVEDDALEDVLKEVFPSKEEVSSVKVQLHKGGVATIYCFKKNPVCFEFYGKIFPALQAVWSYPLNLTLLSTQLAVISKLSNGADLMLPGIVFPSNPGDFPNFDKGKVVGINTTENLSALAIGIALISSDEMLNSVDKRGKAVEIVHVFGDYLWSMGDKKQPPQINPIEKIDLINVQSCEPNIVDTEREAIEDSSNVLNAEEVTTAGDISQPFTSDSEKKLGLEETADDDASETEQMDKLLEACFLTALKTKLKDKDLPILASNFYRLFVLPSCPNDKHLEIKKTSFKKLGKYLKYAEGNALIEVKELSKGNDSIVAVNRAHERYRSFKVDTNVENQDDDPPTNTESYCGVITQKQYEPPEISTVYAVNQATLRFFENFSLKKGAVVTAQGVRQMITDYVKENELSKGRRVVLDPVLHKVLCAGSNGDTDELPWEDLFKRMILKMQLNHKIAFKGAEPIVKKGEPPVITISTQVRSGNKKVTLVRNLEGFFIDPQHFADLIRKQAQASTSLTTLPSTKAPLQQVLIQGNQVNTVESILTGEKFRLPQKYLRGLENAPKKKGKGR